MPTSLPSQVVLGFDFGMKYIGTAVGQTLIQSATPLTTLSATDGVPDWQLIADLIQTWQPQQLLVGLPINMDGTSQSITQAAKRFGEQLRKQFQLPVQYVDERLTSVEARARLYEAGGYRALSKSTVDSVAAQLIVETWMLMHNA